MARRQTDLKLLLVAIGVVFVIAGALGLGAYHVISQHRDAAAATPDGAPALDAAPLDLPDTIGPRCGGEIVKLVREHPSRVPDKNLEVAARDRIAAEADKRKVGFLVHGWRGREDREKRHLCRVSFRYEISGERGASVWLVDPEAPPHARLEPQDRLSLEVTKNLAWPDSKAESRFRRKCAEDGMERLQRHFSYKENYSIQRCLQKRSVEVRRREGIEIEYGLWGVRVEGPDRCLVYIAYTEDTVAKTAYYRLRYLPRSEYAVEPLTARAIESIYGPNIFSR